MSADNPRFISPRASLESPPCPSLADTGSFSRANRLVLAFSREPGVA